MNPRIKQLWIDALRSGEYTQAEGQLRVRVHYNDGTYSYCCLGVLCELAVAEGVIETSTDGYAGRDKILPVEVMHWADLPDAFGSFGHPDTRQDLARSNDEGASFEEIADLIEKYF